jgi:hypothetical protein
VTCNEKKVKQEHKGKKPVEKPKTKPVIADADLLDLTPDNVLAIITKLGGKDVTTSQIVPYLKLVHEGIPQKKYQPTARKCLVLVKDGKLTMPEHEKGAEYKFSLP